jgi:hypothetical protein
MKSHDLPKSDSGSCKEGFTGKCYLTGTASQIVSFGFLPNTARIRQVEMPHKGKPSSGCKQRLSTWQLEEITQGERMKRHSRRVELQGEKELRKGEAKA